MEGKRIPRIAGSQAHGSSIQQHTCRTSIDHPVIDTPIIEIPIACLFCNAQRCFEVQFVPHYLHRKRLLKPKGIVTFASLCNPHEQVLV